MLGKSVQGSYTRYVSTDIRMGQILEKRKSGEVSMQRRTHIVCTLGPSCADEDTLVNMIDAGMNVCRLNFSHGDHASHLKTLQILRSAERRRPHSSIAVILDTKGPEIRTGLLKNHNHVQLIAGQELKIVMDYQHIGDEKCIACSYSELSTSVCPGSIILIADGTICCEVVQCLNNAVITKVKNSAILGEKKNMNLPNVKVNLPCIGEKDKDDILNFAIPNGCNFIAASFVQSAEDIRTIRRLLGNQDKDIKIISKIENVEGLLNFDEILMESDGIMVARGDLGMEIPPEKVFLAQKMMIAKCNAVGIPVITATQMLESMTKNPRPTRAEAADIANAVLDGTDCVMLSGETANGNFPVEAVDIMSRICFEAESCINYPLMYRAICSEITTPLSKQESVARAAVEAAESCRAVVILALSQTGYTSRLIAKYRPSQIIISLSGSEHTMKHLCLHRGIISIFVSSFHGSDQLIKNALEVAKERRFVKAGDLIVAVHGIKEDVPGSSNLLKVVEVE